MYISIGIPIYNAEKYLENAIKSVLNQTYTKWELLLVDDGSTDHSLNIAKKYEKFDSRIRVIHDGKNKKLPSRLNQIIHESKYDFIARMDADDIMHPQRLEKQIRILTEENYDLVSSSYYTIDSQDNVVSSRIIVKEQLAINDFLNGNYYILHPSIMARKQWYLENSYNPEFDRAEDYELWFRSIINNKLNIKILKEQLMFYREEGSVSKNKQLLSYKATDAMLNKYKSDLGSVKFLKAKLRNFFKIFIYSFFYNGFLQKILLERRNNLNKFKDNTEEGQFVLDKIINSPNFI